MNNIYILIFIIYFSIATFIFCNFLFNPNLNMVLVNKRNQKEKSPSIKFLMFYCLFWIIFVPLSKHEGEE